MHISEYLDWESQLVEESRAQQFSEVTALSNVASCFCEYI